MTPSEILEEAAKLLEKGWCQGAFAKDDSGNPVPVHSTEARSWCVQGALNRVGRYYNLDKVVTLLVASLKPNNGIDPTWVLQNWNDARYRTKAQAVRLLRQCAKKASK